MKLFIIAIIILLLLRAGVKLATGIQSKSDVALSIAVVDILLAAWGFWVLMT